MILVQHIIIQFSDLPRLIYIQDLEQLLIVGTPSGFMAITAEITKVPQRGASSPLEIIEIK